MKRKRLGEVLRESGKISEEALTKIISDQQGKVIHLGELLLERGLVDKGDLLPALREVTGIPYVDCTKIEPSAAALQRIPRAVAERFCALPLDYSQSKLTVAFAEPQNLNVVKELGFIGAAEIIPQLGFSNEIVQAIERCYGASDTTASNANGGTKDAKPADAADGVSDEMEFVSTSSRQANKEAYREEQAEILHKRTPAVKVVSEIIHAALARRASDIHIEPQSSDTWVRLRVDGELRDLRHVPRAMQNSLISRIKILADMDIAERRTPQDGRFLVISGERRMDMRVSTLPTQYGEKIVMRLLESEAPAMSFVELGLPADIHEALYRLLKLPQGMLLVTGPTGSGKSTTLYAALHQIRKPTLNIVTIEDPIEYVLSGINQVHVNTRAGLTFAGCLRSILRQDPNVVMIGEIRDHETAEIAMKAAQTGHLVLSTLHTNDSVSAAIRLLDLEVPPYLIAASLSGVLAQRLVRKLCTCRIKEPAGTEFKARLSSLTSTSLPEHQYRSVGCAVCEGSGFKGRIGVYELLVVDEAVRSALREGRIELVQEAARAQGMKTMQVDALNKVSSGITTLDEVIRVISFEDIEVHKCHICDRPQTSNFHFCPYCGTAREQADAQAELEEVRQGR